MKLWLAIYYIAPVLFMTVGMAVACTLLIGPDWTARAALAGFGGGIAIIVWGEIMAIRVKREMESER